MDVAAVQKILQTSYLRGAFQAFLLTSSRHGITVQTLAEQVGVSKRTMYRYLAKIRASERRDPHAELVDAPVGVPAGCRHADVFFLGRKRICLKCLRSNFDAELKQQRLADEREDREANRIPAKFKPKGAKKQAVA